MKNIKITIDFGGGDSRTYELHENLSTRIRLGSKVVLEFEGPRSEEFFIARVENDNQGERP